MMLCNDLCLLFSILKTDQTFCSHFLRSDTDKQIRCDQRFTKTQDKIWTGVWLLEHFYPRICNFRKVRQHLFALTFIFLFDYHLYWGLFNRAVLTCRCDAKWKIWKWMLSKECQTSEGKNFNKLLIIRQLELQTLRLLHKQKCTIICKPQRCGIIV